MSSQKKEVLLRRFCQTSRENSNDANSVLCREALVYSRKFVRTFYVENKKKMAICVPSAPPRTGFEQGRARGDKNFNEERRLKNLYISQKICQKMKVQQALVTLSHKG